MKVVTVFVLVIVLSSVFVLTPPRAGATTNANPVLTIRITSIQDTYADINHATTNYCSAPQMLVRATNNIAGATAYSYVQFPITSVPSNAVIVSAVLSEFLLSNQVNKSAWTMIPAVGQFGLGTVNGAWSECTVTWNNQPALTGVANIVTQMFSNATATYPQPMPFDITAIAKKWLSGSVTNNGLALLWNDVCAPGCGSNGPNEYAIFSTFNATVSNPFVTIQYQLPQATIYPAYVCYGGPCETQVLSGSGLPAYLFNVTYSENNGTYRQALRPDLLLTNVSTYYTLRVGDFFGNLLYNQSKVVTSSIFLWRIYIPYGIFETVSQRDYFTGLKITPAGGASMSVDLPPRSWWVIPLKTGVSYTFNFTFLNSAFQVLTYVSITQVMGAKLDYIVNGTSITQVLQSANGAWNQGNTTTGLVGGVGNVVLAPRGLDFFRPLYFGVASWSIAGGFMLGLNLWTVLLVSEIVGLALFMWSTRDLKWFKDVRRALQRKPLAATFLIVLGFFLFLSAILAVTTGRFIVPFPVTIP